jgi:F-type H+-transporting ATPase subunit delta
MTSRTTGLRYLSALFDICRERNTVEDVLGVLVSLSGAIEESRELKDFLFNPRIARKEKKTVLLNLLEGAPALARDFACLLVDKGREEVLGFAGDEFKNLLRDSRNVLIAQVQAARVLDEAFKDELKKRLDAATGKKVDLVEEVKEELLGGVRVILGSKMIDASLKNRLENMRRALKGGEA